MSQIAVPPPRGRPDPFASTTFLTYFLGVLFLTSFWYRFDTEKSVKMERRKHGLDIASDTRETLWMVH